MGALDGVKIGDELCCYFAEHIQGKRMVASMTATTLTDNFGIKWIKCTGYEYGSSRFSKSFVSLWTPDHDTQLAEQNETKERNLLANRLRDFRFRDCDLATLKQIAALIKLPETTNSAPQAS